MVSQTRRFCRCIKDVRRSVKPIQGTPESAAIAICVKSVLQKHGRTLKKFSCRGKGARVITQRRKRGGGTSASKSRSSKSRGQPYYITLQADGASVKIHRPGSSFILREGDLVKGITYINATKTMVFKLKNISYGLDRVIRKLTFTFEHQGSTVSPALSLDAERIVQFENLRGGISVPNHQFAQLAKHIQKINKTVEY
jgi:hypothetical protein